MNDLNKWYNLKVFHSNYLGTIYTLSVNKLKLARRPTWTTLSVHHERNINIIQNLYFPQKQN